MRLSHHCTYGSRIQRFAYHHNNCSFHQLRLFPNFVMGWAMLSQFNFRKINVQSFINSWELRIFSAHVLLTTMTSADFSICITYSSRPPSVRWISLCLSLLHLLFRYYPFFLKKPERLWTSAACGTSSDLIASVCSFCSSVQTLQSGLLQFLSHLRQPCRLLSFRARPQRLRDFHPLEHSISWAIFTIQGTHKVQNGKWGYPPHLRLHRPLWAIPQISHPELMRKSINSSLEN